MYRLANDSQRHSIYGKTGSGKTVGGLFYLEKRSWPTKPWTIFDFKRDRIIREIPRLEEIDIRHPPPKKPGLYVVRPLPELEQGEVENYLWKVWDNEDHGIFVDESYMMGRFNKAYDSLWTQGRSKNIPIIALSQRPSWLSRFQMTESEFHQLFHLRKPEDLDRLREYMPGIPEKTRRNFHSYYYDDERDELIYLHPTPDENEILNRFDLRMRRPIHHFSGWLENAERERRRA